MDWLTDIIKLFLDNTYKIKHKLWLFISVSFIILMVDNHLGLSTHWYTKNKVEDIEKIEKLLESKTLNPQMKQQLVHLENEVVVQKNVMAYFFEFLSSIDSFSSLPKSTISIKTSADTMEYSIFYHVISSSFWILIVMIIFLGYIVKSIFTKDTKNMETVKELIILFGGLIISIILISVLFFYILPKYSQPSANYWINFLVSTFFICGFIIFVLVKQLLESHKQYDKLDKRYNNLLSKQKK